MTENNGEWKEVLEVTTEPEGNASSEDMTESNRVIDNNVFYNVDSIRDQDTVYITERVTDCICMLKAGLPCISPKNTSFKEADIETVVRLCSDKKTVNIVNYNDKEENGLEWSVKTAIMLEKRGIRTGIIRLPRQEWVDRVDIAEYLKSYGAENLTHLVGISVWLILLSKEQVMGNSYERAQIAKDFIQNMLVDMDPLQRKTFAMNEVRIHFSLKVKDMENILKEVDFQNILGTGRYFTGDGKFIPSRMSEDIQKDMRIITMADTKEMWRYQEDIGCYRPKGEDVVRKKAKDILGNTGCKRYGDEVVYAILLDTLTDREEFDKDDGCINLQNGYYSTNTQEFYPHSPEKYFSSTLPFKYDLNAKCKVFDDYLDKIGVNKRVIYEIFAYCLVRGYPIQVIIMFVGDGGNGKGTVLRVLKTFLGEESTTGHSMQALEKNPYAMADLYRKSANICGDMPPSIVKDTSLIKTLSGGDVITARMIYKGNISFVNSAKLIFSMNHIPEFDDNTDSLHRRLVVVEFNTRVEGADSDFDEGKLSTPEELSGIFNKCMEVLPDLLKRGEFTGRMCIKDTREYIQKKGSPVAAFVDECGYISTESITPVEEVYAAYVRWCRENNETLVIDKVFGRKLAEIFPHEITKTRRRIRKEKVGCYKGIELRSEYKGLNITR